MACASEERDKFSLTRDAFSGIRTSSFMQNQVALATLRHKT